MTQDRPAQPTMPRWKVWLLASRPATLTAVVSPLLVGGALAVQDGVADLGAWLAAFLGALFIQLGTNYANDVFDYEKGADTAERVGPLRVTQAGLVTPRQMRAAMVLAFALATVCGTALVWRCGWPIVWLGLASIASGVLYTGGPWPLGYNGLGDAFVFLFFGLAATVGTYFVQAGTTTPLVWIWAVPVGATCTAIIIVNNLRDIDTDVQVGKRTLAVRFGAEFVRTEYAAMWALALAIPVALALNARAPLLALPVLILPLAMKLLRTLRSTRDPAVLNPLLGATARLHLLAGVLSAVGIWLTHLQQRA